MKEWYLNIRIFIINFGDMGACVVGDRDKSKKEAKYQSKTNFSELELQLLEKMYSNLSSRCRNRQLSRQTFDIFFHSSGLIGEIIFLKFDSSNKGIITLQQFVKAFEVMIKGTFEQRASVLFDIYDIEKTGGINFSQLLKILFSYPTEELNKMLLEQAFLKFIGENQLSYYFGAEHKNIQERNIIEEVSEDSEQEKDKKKEDYVPASVVFHRLQTDQNIDDYKKDLHELKKDPSILRKKLNKKTSLVEKKKKGVSQSSVLTIESFKKNRKNPKIQSNIASLTKKYANFLFTSYNLDKDKDELSKQNFLKLVQEHPAIFNVYLAGFHTYIWQIDKDEPLFMKITPYIENYAKEIYQEKSSKAYLKFIKTTVFVFDHMKAKMPREIICLEGLFVTEVTTKGEYGIVFKHRDGLYPQKQYYFDSKQVQEEWLRQTVQFRESTLFDQFTKMQRIGGGNFSNVFKGKDKKTNKEVAIKVIQNFKLTSAQREVIKRQCGILRNCHHPNIIKFLGEFKTKSSMYIVTELLSEGDLFDYTKKQGFLQEYEASIIFRQLVESMIYLNHELGIIHRDLKPQNIMIILNNEKKLVHKIKLIDFGFAVYKDKLNQLPLAEKYAGTPGFIAPEIYKQEPYDQKIDTFSLGIILYFMLSGYLPFQSNFIEEIADMTKNCTYSIVNVHWSNISEEAKDIITKTLTFKQNRISATQLEKHPWLENTQRLKSYNGINKKSKIH